MAINPVTIMAAIKAATIILKKENRQNIWIVLIFTLGLVALLLLVVIYILSSPLNILGGFFGMGELSELESFKVEHDNKVLIMASGLEWQGSYPLPMKNAVITSDYGSRTDPTTGEGSEFHEGMDLSAYWQAPVISIADGVVEKVNTATSDYGN